MKRLPAQVLHRPEANRLPEYFGLPEAWFHSLAPEHTTLVAGSVTTSAGTVVSEDPPWEPVEVSVGELAVGGEVTVTFRVTVDSPIPVGVAVTATEVANQATTRP